jgi:hypothetical protein
MSYSFSFLFPVMVIALLLSIIYRKLRIVLLPVSRGIAIILLAYAISLIPIKGIPLARWLVSFEANISIPLQALVLGWLWQEITGDFLFEKKDYLCFWILGIVGGLVLYPMAMGWGSIDPYSWGFCWNGFFIVLGLITVGLIAFGYRVGWVLIAVILAYCLGLLESHNLWDYLLDPFYFLISVMGLLRRTSRTGQTRLTR